MTHLKCNNQWRIGVGAPGARLPFYKIEKDKILEKKIGIFCKKSSSSRSNPYVFGIIGKLFESVRDQYLSRSDIINFGWVIQVSNLEIYTLVRFCLYFGIFFALAHTHGFLS